MGLLLLGLRISKGAFEGDEFGPTDSKFARDPATLHAVRGINGLGTTDEHFLGITSAQCTGSTERTMIHDGNRPTRLSDPRARALTGGPPFNHPPVNTFHSAPLPPKTETNPFSTKSSTDITYLYWSGIIVTQ